MKIFSQEVCRSGKEATVKSGIDKLIPGAAIDEFLFEPCGYSMNGYIKGVSTALYCVWLLSLSTIFVARVTT